MPQEVVPGPASGLVPPARRAQDPAPAVILLGDEQALGLGVVAGGAVGGRRVLARLGGVARRLVSQYRQPRLEILRAGQPPVGQAVDVEPAARALSRPERA